VLQHKTLKKLFNPSRIKKLIISAKKHWFVALMAGIFAFASGTQATSWLLDAISKEWNDTVGWMSHEQKLLDQVGPGVQAGYFRSVFGEPIFRDGSEKYKEYVFKRKFGYIQIISDNRDKTLLYSVVVCSSNFKPKIHLATGDVVMQRDSLLTKGGGDTYYFISGATANSYLIEGHYGGNPTNYQEIYLGATDSCGGLDVSDLKAMYEMLSSKKCYIESLGKPRSHCRYDVNDPEIKSMRSKIKINTIVTTAPGINIEDLQSSIQFGPDRTELRVLPGYGR